MEPSGVYLIHIYTMVLTESNAKKTPPVFYRLPAPDSKPSRLIHTVAATHTHALKQTGLRSEFPSLSLETSLP